MASGKGSSSNGSTIPDRVSAEQAVSDLTSDVTASRNSWWNKVTPLTRRKNSQNKWLITYSFTSSNHNSHNKVEKFDIPGPHLQEAALHTMSEIERVANVRFVQVEHVELKNRLFRRICGSGDGL